MQIISIKVINNLVFLLLFFNFNAQLTFYQDVFYGGVTGDGYNPWYYGPTGNFNINIASNSSIRKAFLICNVYGEPENKTIIFGGNDLKLIHNEALNNNFIFNTSGFDYNIRTLVLDVTNFINPSINQYTIEPPLNQPSPTEGGIYADFYLLVLYENQILNKVNTYLFINDKDAEDILTYDIVGLNSINIQNNVSLSINSSHFCDTILDGSIVYINNNNIGLIGGKEDNTEIECNGVVGSFYYQNETLFGIGNDIANSTMKGTDAIANIETYLINNNSFILKFNSQNIITTSNPVYELFLTYTTNCDTFSITHSSDTIICPNTPLPLFASGGVQYEWLANGSSAANVLSCTDCPNPTFIGDKSTLLTVQIWNNDTCSVVRPIKINVKEKLNLNLAMSPTPSECGGNTGAVTLSYNNHVLSSNIDGGAQTTNKTFENLTSGSHIIRLMDENACTFDTLINISEINSTIANFTPNPNLILETKSVIFEQKSINASTYDWYINDLFVDEVTNYIFDTAGIYEVKLIAWLYDPSCADTFFTKLYVYDNFTLAVPNIFSPNDDTKNDVFGITVSDEIEVTYQILNRWGNEIKNGVLSGKGFIPLWDGEKATDGTYFYTLSLVLKEDLMLPKTENENIIDKTDFPIKVEGWVQVVK